MVELSEPAAVFDALAHQTRLAVVRLLVPAGPGGVSAGDLGARLDLPASALSFHLNRLAAAGLVRARRDGRRLYYAVDYARISWLIDFLAEDCCASAPAGCLPDCPGGRPGAAGLAKPERSDR